MLLATVEQILWTILGTIVVVFGVSGLAVWCEGRKPDAEMIRAIYERARKDLAEQIRKHGPEILEP